MTSPYAGRSNWDVDPDYNVWFPALRPVEFEAGDLDLQAWASKLAYVFFAEGGYVAMCKRYRQHAKQTGLLKTLAEKELQRFLKDHLRSREVDVQEGTEIGGGESDLVLPGPLIVENKVRENTADPFEVGQHYVWQARRYSIPISSRVSFVVLAYRPADEYTILPMSRRIAVAIPDSGPKGHVQIRVVVPWGEGVPSSAKAPK